MRQLLGTRWQDCLRGEVLFFEEESLSNDIGNIERDCTHLLNAGLFENLNGLIIGRWHSLTIEEQNAANDLVENILSDYSFPILCNTDIGHTDPQIFMPIGWKVSSEGTYLEFERPADF